MLTAIANPLVGLRNRIALLTDLKWLLACGAGRGQLEASPYEQRQAELAESSPDPKHTVWSVQQEMHPSKIAAGVKGL